MKNKWIKFGLIFGFISLIVGLALGAIGLSNQGLEQLATATSPNKVHQTLDAVETIDISEIMGRNVYIDSSSPDDQIHVTYQDFEVSIEDLDITVSDNTLFIKQITPEYAINASPLTIIGEEMNRTHDNDTLLIQLPQKTKAINLVNNIVIGRQTHVQDITIKELTGNTGLALNHVTVEKAELVGSNWYFSASNSHLKNFSITGSYQGSIDLSHTILENATFANDSIFSGNIFAEELTIIGNVAVELTDGRVDFKLADESKQTLDVDIQLEKLEENQFIDADGSGDGVAYFDEDDELVYQTEDTHVVNPNRLTIADEISKDAQTTDDLTFKKTVKDAKGKLIIKGKGFSQIIVE